MKPKYKIIDKKNIYKGFFELNKIEFSHEKHDGTWSSQIEREIFGGAHVSTLLPYDPIKKEIILKKNHNKRQKLKIIKSHLKFLRKEFLK